MFHMQMIVGVALANLLLTEAVFAGRPVADDPTDPCQAEQLRLSRERRWLQSESDRLSTRSKKLQKMDRELAATIDALPRERNQLLQRRKQIDAMQFYCPNGEPLSRCTHYAEQRQFAAGKSLAYQELNDSIRKYQNRITAVKKVHERMKAAKKRLRDDQSELDLRRTKFKSDMARVFGYSTTASSDKLCNFDKPESNDPSASGDATATRAGAVSGGDAGK